MFASWGKADRMSDSVIYIVVFVLLIGLGGLAFWIARHSLGFGDIGLFQAKAKRLGLVETTSLDSRRRLVLIRRDNVEHLIITGGPVDMVIETGIPAGGAAAIASSPLLARADNGVGTGLSPYAVEDVPLILQREQTN